ncbi:amidase, partial [Nonomuraea sp. RK-328]|nr:amidase [Nonomuraea sp. RK-328]
MSEPHYLSAAEMARLVRTRQVSAFELLQVCLDRIEQVNPQVNAVVTLAAEQAMDAAKAADAAEPSGPLHGVPVAHKDLVDTAGIRTTYGSPRYAHHVPDADDLIVRRLRRAGAISVGKTNTPEFGTGSH